MKTPINLENTVFNFPAMVGELESQTTILVRSEKRFKPRELLSALPAHLLPTEDIIVPTGFVLASTTDFCTVLVGWDKLTDERWKADIISTLELETREAPVFLAPAGWRMAHILKALGAFQSVGDAKRNGWDKEVEPGMSTHLCRIRKVKGAFVTFKPPEGILVPGSWEACEID